MIMCLRIPNRNILTVNYFPRISKSFLNYLPYNQHLIFSLTKCFFSRVESPMYWVVGVSMIELEIPAVVALALTESINGM